MLFAWLFNAFQCFITLFNAFQCLSMLFNACQRFFNAFQPFFNAFQCFSMLVNAFQCFFHAFQCFFNAFGCFLWLFLCFSTGFGTVCKIYFGFFRFLGKVDKNLKNEFLGAGCPSGWSGQTPATPPPHIPLTVVRLLNKKSVTHCSVCVHSNMSIRSTQNAHWNSCNYTTMHSVRKQVTETEWRGMVGMR